MEFLAPKENFPEIYPIYIPVTGPIRRVRGPGRYLWCAREAAETLRFGGNVWVRTGPFLPEEEFLNLISRIPDPEPLSVKREYDFFSNDAASGLNGRHFFGGYSFSETVGLWLEKGEKDGSNLLSPFISTEGFKFSPEEYLDLLERLRAALRRYDRLPAVSNGLEDLNTGFFRHRNLEESTAFISKHLTEYLQRGAGLHRRFLLTINRHARSEATEKRRELRSRAARLEAMNAEILAAAEMTGRPQKKTISEITTEWEAYKQEYQADDGGKGASTGIEDLRIAVDKELENVDSGFRLMGRALKTDGMSLNALTVNPRHGDADNLRELEGLLNDLLREVDEAGLYQLPLRLTDAATTPRQLQQLDSLLDKLRNTKRHMGELPMFYDRRHFWYAQPAHLRRLLAPLLDLPSQDWEIAFSSWYFERCLEREQRPERFYRKTDLPSQKTTISSESPLPQRGDLVFLTPETPWPTNTVPADLLLDLSGRNTPSGQEKANAYSVSSLSDTSAMHLAVSGYRDPVLVFSQSFQLLHPPHWCVRKVDTPPVSLKNCVLLQLNEDTSWLPLSDWDGKKVEKLNVFLPEELSSVEEDILVERWESVISAAPMITYFHTLTPNAITQGLLSDGLNGAFLISVLLRAAEAAELTPFDHEALIALGHEVRIRCGLSNPGPHPLAVQFGAILARRLPNYFVETHVPWRDTFLPIVLQSPSGKKSVLLPNGCLPGLADGETEAARHQELKTAGFRVLGVNALEVWENLEEELERVSKTIEQ